MIILRLRLCLVSDPGFPWLEVHDFFPFPPPETWEDDIVGVGGNLSPGMLISAYAQGIFPWFNEGEEILWWSLDPRFILYPENLKVSKSMIKVLKSGRFTLTLDREFPSVMDGCAGIQRKGEKGTWISGEMKEAYCRLHDLGFAHSVEVHEEGELVGGLYGISLGNCFIGESMFARVSNASKAALIGLTWFLQEKGFDFVDCQQHTPHLASLGAVDVPRDIFLKELRECLRTPTHRGHWSELFPGFPQSRKWAAITGESH